MSISPWIALFIPRVMMIGGTPAYATPSPLIRPIAAPRPITSGTIQTSDVVAAVREERRQHCGAGEVRRNREVDAAGQHAQGLTHADEPDERGGDQNRADVVIARKPGCLDGADQKEHDREHERQDNRAVLTQCVGDRLPHRCDLVWIIELNVTATIRISPWKKVLQNDVRFSANTRIGISRKAIAPMIELAADPFPPKMLVPPITTAATEARMN